LRRQPAERQQVCNKVTPAAVAGAMAVQAVNHAITCWKEVSDKAGIGGRRDRDR